MRTSFFKSFPSPFHYHLYNLTRHYTHHKIDYYDVKGDTDQSARKRTFNLKGGAPLSILQR